LKAIVQKIATKDKNYNLALASVTECETKRYITKKRIKELQKKFSKLKNESKN